MSKPKLPPLSEVLALAEQADCRVSITDLARMHKHGEMSAAVVDALWPDASPRFKAAYMGLMRHQSEPCPRCGGTVKNVANGRCPPCQLAHGREWYKRNVERKAVMAAAWHQKNREYRNAYYRAMRAKKREMVA